MNDVSPNASAFNCGLITFANLDIGWVSWLLWMELEKKFSRRRVGMEWEFCGDGWGWKWNWTRTVETEIHGCGWE